MAHQVETMMYAGQVPWHGLGVKVEGDALRDWRHCVQAAGLDWTVEQQPLFLADGRQVRNVANIRSTDSAVLGVVGPGFTPLQNSEAFEWFQPWLETGEATLEAAGSLFGGSRIWALAKIAGAEDQVTAGDAVVRYALLSHAHDGTLAARIGFTDVRVVCNNTLTMAHRSKGSELIRIRHTAKIVENLEKVRETMDLARAGFYATMKQFRSLRDKAVNQNDIKRYVQMLIAPDREAIAKRTATRIDEIVQLAVSGIGNHGETMWDAFNAVTQYTTHERGRSQENRVAASWYGYGAELNQQALALALEFEPEKQLVLSV